MEIEIYEKTNQSTEPSEERLQICKSLGLSAQCLSDQNAADFYPEITGEELAFWTVFLPTRYRHSSKSWSYYKFDRIPTEPLRHIQKAYDSKLFDDLEIWTPEKIHEDPIAVGVVGASSDWSRMAQGQFFKIVRWGESLKPWQELTQQIDTALVKLRAKYNRDDIRLREGKTWIRRCCGQRFNHCRFGGTTYATCLVCYRISHAVFGANPEWSL